MLFRKKRKRQCTASPTERKRKRCIKNTHPGAKDVTTGEKPTENEKLCDE